MIVANSWREDVRTVVSWSLRVWVPVLGENRQKRTRMRGKRPAGRGALGEGRNWKKKIWGKNVFFYGNKILRECQVCWTFFFLLVHESGIIESRGPSVPVFENQNDQKPDTHHLHTKNGYWGLGQIG